MNIRQIRSSPLTVVALACLSTMIDNITYTISISCLPHLFEDMNLANESMVGWATTMFGIGSCTLSVLSGLISDILCKSRKQPLVVGALGYGLCGVLLFFAHTKLWHILLYRLLNGLASGLVYPVAIAMVGDVYPNGLLGTQMALLNAFNSAGYILGPALGGILYDHRGVHGVASVLIMCGSMLAVILAVCIREPLQIRQELLVKIEEEKMEDKEEIEEKVQVKMPMWKLALQWPVLSASITTLAMGMLIGSLENVLPIHVKDTFHASATKTGLLFVLNGTVAIALSLPIGWLADWSIKRHGERMRTGMELIGLLLTATSTLAMGWCQTFRGIVGTECLLAGSQLLVNIPVMSSFGDFVNQLGIQSMAQSYGVYNAFWALSSTIAPPIATFVYTRIGYRATVAGLLTGLCGLCGMLILIYPTRQLIRYRATGASA